MKSKCAASLLCFLLPVLFLLSACSKSSQDTLLDLAPMLMLDGRLYVDTGMEEPMGDSGNVTGQIASTVKSNEKPAEHEQSNFGCVGNSYVLSDDGAVVFINDAWYRFDRVPNQLTLLRVLELSEKGEALSWEDFKEYDSIDIGSGLYILLYQMDQNYQLRIGGIPDSKPMYIHLIYGEDQEEFIDIRTDDAEAFVKDHALP